LTWYDAKSDCASRSNGKLVSITNDIMNDVVATNRPEGAGSYWIGGSYTDTWRWESGEPFIYIHWALEGALGPCLSFRNEIGGFWNMCLCGYTNNYICQILPTINKCPSGIYTNIIYTI
jgi:hypothetical protein